MFATETINLIHREFGDVMDLVAPRPNGSDGVMCQTLQRFGTEAPRGRPLLAFDGVYFVDSSSICLKHVISS